MLEGVATCRPSGAAVRWDPAAEGPAWALGLEALLRRRRVGEDRLDPVHRLAGVEVAYGDGGRWAWAAVAVLRYPGLEILECACAREPVAFPYVPGLLGLREAPAILSALERLARAPDLLLVRGQGTAHPRRFGAACHVGVLADLPTVGVASTPLVGRAATPAERAGAWEPLFVEAGEVVGAAVRTRPGVRPLYVSPGHRVGLVTAVEHTVGSAPRYRLPEPLREARRRAREAAREGGREAAG